MKEGIILIGGGGHCRSVIDVIETQGIYEIKGIIDLVEHVGQLVLNYPIIGTEEDIPELVKKHHNFFICVGFIHDVNPRIRIYNLLKKEGANLPVIVSPKAHISKHSTIGEGTLVAHHVVVNANANVGINCILNTGCIVEHDAFIGDHCHISTRSVVNGGCIVGDEVFLGSGAVMVQKTTITNRSIIGAGSLVRKNIDTHGKFAGNPLKQIS